jgi:hypothetical protein
MIPCMVIVTVSNITIAVGERANQKGKPFFVCPLLCLDGTAVATLRSGYNNAHHQNVYNSF